MLQILSHQYLKRFLKSHQIDWEHIYAFGRIVSKCIETNDNYLINSEIFSTNNWHSALLISLFLHDKNSTLVLKEENIKFLKNNHLIDLKNMGFDFIVENDQIIFPNHRIDLVSMPNFINRFKSNSLKKKRIIFSGIENIKKDLKDHLRIALFKKNWLSNPDNHLLVEKEIINTYDFLKKKFFLRKSFNNNYILLEKNEITFLAKFFYQNSTFSKAFLHVSNAFSSGWACWVELDNINFEWILYLEPIDEIFEISNLLINNNFIFLSALRKDNFFKKYIKKLNIQIDLEVNLKSDFNEKKILVYAPSHQMLPNNPLFNRLIIDKCNKLIYFRKGLTLILCDDVNLKIKLATELASKHGKRVLIENIPAIQNDILCAGYNWWIKNAYQIKIPEQIIIPLLPIPNMIEPIIAMTVACKRKNSKDWFRDFLLPEAIEKFEKSVSPLRRNSGKLIILDGRVNKRKWGRSILKSIQPSKNMKYMFPLD